MIRLIPRSEMPQIEETDYPDFIEFAAKRGIEIVVRYLKPKELKPHQILDEFDPSLMPPEVHNKVVFISTECFILDGNHRWMLHKVTRTAVPCFQIKLTFEEAIALMFEFPKTHTVEGQE